MVSCFSGIEKIPATWPIDKRKDDQNCRRAQIDAINGFPSDDPPLVPPLPCQAINNTHRDWGFVAPNLRSEQVRWPACWGILRAINTIPLDVS